MFVSMFMNVIHLAINSILIFGLLGFPQLGVKGTAISTGISRTVALLLILSIMYKRFSLNIKLKDYLTSDRAQIKKILKIGIPAAGEQLCYNASQLVITSMIAILGAAALTTRVYTQSVNSYIVLFGLAMGQGTQILIGYKVGARDFDGAYRQLLKSLKYSFTLTFGIALLICFFRESLLSIFTDNKEIISMGSKLLLFCFI